MTTKMADIAIELYTLSCSTLQTKTFYTAYLDIGPKQSELSHRKSSNIPGILNLNEGLFLSVSDSDLEESNHQAKLSFYSIHHYGRKKLLGNLTFFLSLLPTEQLKLKLQSCQDEHAFVQFRCQTVEIESRVLTYKSNSKSSLFKGASNSVELDSGELSVVSKSRGRSYKGDSVPFPSDKDSNICSSPTADLQINQNLKVTMFQLPSRADGKVKNNVEISVSKNLELLQSCQKVLSKMSVSQLQDPKDLECIMKERRTSKAEVVNKLLNLTNNLNKIHEKEDLLNNQDRIMQMLQEEDKQITPISLETFRNSHHDSSHSLKSQQYLATQNGNKLSIENHVHDFIYIDAAHPARLMVQKKGDQNMVYRRRSLLLRDHKDRDDSFLDKETVKQEPCVSRRKNRAPIIKPKLRLQSSESLEECQNDGDLQNILQGMINDAKVNLGFIKLSKLSYLRNQIKEIKDRNKNLLKINEDLIKNERLMTKKLLLSDQIIKDKERILAVQFQTLREEFKTVTKKLLDKYKEEKDREAKIKLSHQLIKKYQEQVKSFQQKMELKDRQVQHLKLLLVADQRQQKEPVDEEMSIDLSNVENHKKFQRTTSNSRFFKPKREDSELSKHSYLRSQKSQRNIDQKKPSLESLKGINPNFRDFFLTFVSKPQEIQSKKNLQLPRHQLKRGLAQHREQTPTQSPKRSPTSSNNVLKDSGLFLEI